MQAGYDAENFRRLGGAFGFGEIVVMSRLENDGVSRSRLLEPKTGRFLEPKAGESDLKLRFYRDG